jgi:hypothetical protein
VKRNRDATQCDHHGKPRLRTGMHDGDDGDDGDDDYNDHIMASRALL